MEGRKVEAGLVRLNGTSDSSARYRRVGKKQAPRHNYFNLFPKTDLENQKNFFRIYARLL